MKNTKHNLLLHRTFQYVILIIILSIIGGGIYKYFQAKAAKINMTQNLGAFNVIATPVLVQGTTADNLHNTGSQHAAKAMASMGAGNTVIVMCVVNGVVTVPTVSDTSAQTTWGAADAGPFTFSTVMRAYFFSARTGTGGANTVSCDSAIGVSVGIFIWEVAGLQQIAPYDVSASVTETTDPQVAPSVTPTSNFGFNIVASLSQADPGAVSVVSPWNNLVSDGNMQWLNVASKVYTSNTAITGNAIDPANSVSHTMVNILYKGDTTGLVGHWTFDGTDTNWTSSTTGTTNDTSGSGYTGTLTNMSQATSIADGKIGQALTFDGVDDYVAITGISIPDWQTTGSTVSMWVKDFPDNTQDVGIFEMWNSAIVGQRLRISTSEYVSFQRWEVRVGREFSAGEIQMTQGATTTNTTLWHHIVVTASSSAGRLYIDGVEVLNDTTISAFRAFNFNSIRIGGAVSDYYGANSSPSYAGATVDDVRVYNRALSADDVANLYRMSGAETNTSALMPQGIGNLNSGLAGYWKLDENTGTTTADASTNAAVGTLTNSPAWTTGQINYGVDFDGTDDFITTPDADVLDVTDSTNFTLSGWFNRDTFTTDDTILAKSNGQTATDTGYVVYVDDTTDKLVFNASDGTDRYQLESTSTFTATGWHHFTIVWDDSGSTNTKLYIDGVVEGSTATGTFANVNSLANALAFRIGEEVDDGNPFDGKLDEIRLYNRTLSADEVTKLYQLTTPTGVDTSLKGYWSFDGNATNWTSSTAGTAIDLSGSGNNGTLTNMTRAASPVEGKIGQALYFDGTNDYISFTSPFPGAAPTEISISVWMSGTPTNKTAVSPGTFGGAARIWLGTLSDKWTFQVAGGTDRVQSTGNASAGMHHIVGTYNGVTARIYVDGVLNNSATINVAIAGISGASRIGDTVAGGSNWPGIIDDVRIYNRVLSASEIAGLYNMGGANVNTSALLPQGIGNLNSGLAAYFKLDENTGTTTTDASTNAAVGTLTNGPAWWTSTAPIGTAVDFDGTDDFITTPDTNVLDIADSTNFTLSGWFNRDTFTTDDTILAKSNGQTAADTGYTVYIDDSTDKVTFVANDGTDQYKLESVSTFTATGWHHFTIVWDDSVSTNTKLYIDGSAEAATATGTFANVNSLANALALRLGEEVDNGNPFDGKLDEVRLYKRTLSTDEIAKLYQQSTPTGTDTSLKGYWSFDGKATNWTSSTAGTAIDLSGTGNVGTLTNMSRSTSPVEGKIGQALYFDGTNDYVAINGVATVGTGSFTISSWVRLGAAHNSGSATRPIFANNDAPSTNDVMLCFQGSGGFCQGASTGALCFPTYNGSGWNSLCTASRSWPANVWYHVVAVMDTSVGKTIYVDGTAVISDAITTRGSVVSNLADIGATIQGGTSYFLGNIDDTRIYNRVLSATEIASLYNLGR